MDPETVIAVGSLFHDLLGLFGGIILCYFGYRLWMRRIKAYPGDAKWSWKKAKILFKQTAPGTMFALLGAVQIWLTASNGLRGEGTRFSGDSLKENAQGAVKTGVESPSVLTLAAGGRGEASRNLAQEPGLASLITEGNSISGAKSAVFSHYAKPLSLEGDEKSRAPDSKPNGRSALKDLERQRLAAEKKRSRLEELYQNGAISSEAYKIGEDQYRLAILRYREQVNASQVDTN
jgi:hypothetical protein